jgi:hypothetical protein
VAVRFFFFTEWIQGIPQGYVVSATLNAPLALPFHFVFLPFLPTDKITPTFLHPVLLITNYSLRVALGIVIMADVLDRVSDLRAHYSDEGYVPRVLTIKHFWITGYVRYSRNYSDPCFFFFLLVPGAERAFQPAYGERIREFCRGDVRSAGTFSAESVTAIL